MKKKLFSILLALVLVLGLMPMQAALAEGDETYTVTLTANPPEGGTVSGAGTYSYEYPVLVYATPNSGYRFLHWKREDGSTFDDVSFSFEIHENRIYEAVFEPLSYTVTYKVVNGTWDDNTTEDRTETVYYGSSPADVPTGMRPGAGFAFGDWDADPANAIITGDRTFTYTFEAEPISLTRYRVTVSSGMADKTMAYPGNPVTITAAAAPEGKGFKEWTGVDGLTFTSGGTRSATATFTMPARDVTVTATYDYDYLYTVTYRVVNGTWGDGTTADLYETVLNGKFSNCPWGMKPFPGYGNGHWINNPNLDPIYGDTTFTYTFEALPSYTVTYRVVNGTWVDGTTADWTETVYSGSSPAGVPIGMRPGSGFAGGAWDTDPANATVIEDRIFTYTFDPLPVITAQPSDQTVPLGSPATFQVTATGATGFQWQWSKDGTTWNNCSSSGYNTAKFSFTMSSTFNGRKYRCVVSNAAGSVNSNAATVTLLTITTQPKSVNAAAGATVKLTVAASGTGLQYQWQYQKPGESTWNNCSSTGYNKATFSFTMASTFNGRKYRCKVTNDAGSVFSNAATVKLLPSITTQPKNVTAAAGATVKLTVAATGATKYQWQWSKDGTTWNNCSSSGYDTATFSFTMSSIFNGRKYRCVVSNAAGSVNSNAATVKLLPSITTQPKNVTAAAGATVKLTVAATSATKYQWQWSSDGTTWKNCTMSGATTATFSFTMASTFNGRKYRCKVTNDAGSVFSNAATVKLLPSITTQPKNVTAAAGATVKLTVAATGATKYQWQWSSDGTTWKNCTMSGATTATFSFTASAGLSGRKYRCIVSNSAGSTTSSVATVTVK